jgi:hypothetical protein
MPRLFVVVRDADALPLLWFLACAGMLKLLAVPIPIRIPGHAALQARSPALIEGVIPGSPFIHGDSPTSLAVIIADATGAA